MINFEYYTPTQVVFGKETQKQVGKLIKKEGSRKVLVHYGSQSARKSGLLDEVFASLKESNIEYIELGGVVANPLLSLVREGIELCRKENVDFILAVGGGSVIDSAKAIGYGVPAAHDVWDFYSGKAVPESCLPIGTVLTIAAAGSEMSNSSVITKDDTQEKRGYGSDLSRCRFAIMNPALTVTLPAYQTACGCADILMHTLERYFTNEETMEITDSIAEGLLRTVIENANILSRTPDNYEARAEVMWAGSLSHNGLTSCGGGNGDWASHQLAHELSGKFNTAHGAALTAVWGSWARYVYKEDPARFARFANKVLDIADEGDEEEMALAGIEEMESFFWGLGLPTSIKEAGIDMTEAVLQEFVTGCSRGNTRKIGAFKTLDEADIRAIYKMAATGEED
ncbi:MAG: iron-containing alcohol dehydrogenase [Oscillospiraceae bacterium]